MPLEIIIKIHSRTKLVRYINTWPVYYLCNKQSNMHVLKAHFTLPRNQGFLYLKYHKFSSTM
jgi:hypothetical protein